MGSPFAGAASVPTECKPDKLGKTNKANIAADLAHLRQPLQQKAPLRSHGAFCWMSRLCTIGWCCAKRVVWGLRSVGRSTAGGLRRCCMQALQAASSVIWMFQVPLAVLLLAFVTGWGGLLLLARAGCLAAGLGLLRTLLLVLALRIRLAASLLLAGGSMLLFGSVLLSVFHHQISKFSTMCPPPGGHICIVPPWKPEICRKAGCWPE